MESLRGKQIQSVNLDRDSIQSLIDAECDPRNTPSWKLLEKVGLNREAHFKQNIWFHRDENGKPIWKDTLFFVL